MGLARQAVARLQDRLDPRLFAPLASVLMTIKRKDRCAVRLTDGDWIHRYRTGTVVQPFLGGESADGQDRNTSDIFLHGYRPKPGDTVFDLGAGTGSEARLLSRLVGPEGRVISVEAHPRIFACLKRTVELNRLENVTAVHCAVAGVPGTVFLQDDLERHVSNGITLDPENSIAVPGRTLVDLVDQYGTGGVDLLKMNIEGAELPVLAAAGRVLPLIRNLVVSCHDFKADRVGGDWQRTYVPVRELLAENHYRLQARRADQRPWVPFYIYAARE